MAELNLGISREVFLRDYWQQKPLLIRAGFTTLPDLLSPDELVGLACEDEVESRLIIEHGKTPWELQKGPFDDTAFADLPKTNWTLLVQAVDHYLPEVEALKTAFDFIPDWRLDDVMVSFAPKGGSVGPHFDQYDVFLVQGQGQREWSIGQWCDQNSERIANCDLDILAEFKNQDTWVLNEGDILYLPPGLAHHGIAVDDCMTYSIGFRAPSHNEILADWCDEQLSQGVEDKRYKDTELENQPLDQGAEITESTIYTFKQIIQNKLNDEQSFNQWLGQFLSQPKYPDVWEEQQLSQDEQVTLKDIQSLPAQTLIYLEPSARLNYIKSDSGIDLFANGTAYSLPLVLLEWLQQSLAAKAFELNAETESQTELLNAQQQLIVDLVNQGVGYLED